MKTSPQISIIIPLAPGEEPHAYQRLVEQLLPLKEQAEILVASATITSPPAARAPGSDSSAAARAPGTRHIKVRSGRAAAMNDAAKEARGQWLWFLHADSLLLANTLVTLQSSPETYRERSALLWFKLKFVDGCPMMKLNQWGANLRSSLLGLPFGDQGFLIKKADFILLGQYNESTVYGEDHLLCWQAKRNGFKIHRLDAYLGTSARKYSNAGWLKTSWLHQRLFWRQVATQFKRKKPS